MKWRLSKLTKGHCLVLASIFAVVFLLFAYWYGNQVITEKFSPGVVEMLENMECPEGCNKEIQLTQIMTKLNSIQSDVSTIDSTTKATNKQAKETQAYLEKLEAEIRKDFADMEKEISAGMEHKG